MFRTMFAGLVLAATTLFASPALAQDQNGSLMGRPSASVTTGSVTISEDGSVTMTCAGLTLDEQYLAAKRMVEVIAANKDATFSCVQAISMAKQAQLDALGKAEIDHAVALSITPLIDRFEATAFLDDEGRFNADIPAPTLSTLASTPASPPTYWNRETGEFATWAPAMLAAAKPRSGSGVGARDSDQLVRRYADLNGPPNGQRFVQQTTTTTQQQTTPPPVVHDDAEAIRLRQQVTELQQQLDQKDEDDAKALAARVAEREKAK